MARQIRDSDVVKTPDVVIDSIFFVPEDIVGVRQATEEELVPSTDDEYDDGSTEYSLDVDEETDVLDTPGTLQTPQYVNVVSQTVRFTADGRSVVDVVLDVENVPGAINYEVRVSI